MVDTAPMQRVKYYRHGSFPYTIVQVHVRGRKQWRWLVLERKRPADGSARKTMAFGRFRYGKTVIEGGVIDDDLRSALEQKYKELRYGDS